MASKVKKKPLKIKKRRPKATQGVKAQDAGEHQDRQVTHKLIIGGLPDPDKVVKRWRVATNSSSFYYQILFMSAEEVRDFAQGRGSQIIFFSFTSFSRARQFVYHRVRSDIKKLLQITTEIRNARKSHYVTE